MKGAVFPASVLWLLALLAALVAAAVVFGLPATEQRLRSQADTAIDGTGLTVSVAGRDVALSGTVAHAAAVDEATAALQGVGGIRSLDLSGVTVTSEPRPAPHIVVTIGEHATVSGLVGDQAAADAIDSALASLFGVGSNDLIVDATADDRPWVHSLADVIEGADGWINGELRISDDGIDLTGIVESDAVGMDLIEGLSSAAPLDIRYSLDVISGLIPALAASWNGIDLTLDGALSESAEASTLTAASAYSSVQSSIITGPVADAPWISLVPTLLDRLDTWPAWAFTIDGAIGTFTGRGPSSSDVEQMRQLLDATGVAWNSPDIEVAADSLARELTAAAAGTINFASASTELDEESRTVLDRIASSLLENPSAVLVVEGHTDNVGGEAENLTLSQARAEAVVAYLVESGIDPDRLSAIGYGESRPITENGTLFGRAQNRRIEFVVDA